MEKKLKEIQKSEAAVSAQLDLIWGIDNIGAVIGRKRSQTYELLRKGILPAKNMNGRWVISRAVLENFFRDAAA